MTAGRLEVRKFQERTHSHRPAMVAQYETSAYFRGPRWSHTGPEASPLPRRVDPRSSY